MVSTYKCIRIKNVKKPLRSRCGKPLGKNRILCDACFSEAKQRKIPVLMCNDVIDMFNIKFRSNTVFVYIDLSKKKASNKDMDAKEYERVVKSKLYDGLDDMDDKSIKSFFNQLGLTYNSVVGIEKNSNTDNDEIRFSMTKQIVEELIKKGS